MKQSSVFYRRYATERIRLIYDHADDQPEAFHEWSITVLTLSEETLGIWQGAGGYYHRRKACAIQVGVALAGKTIFIDTDTVFSKTLFCCSNALAMISF